MDIDPLMTRLNPLILRVLDSRVHRLLSGQLMSLTFTGRRSGRKFTIPVGYQRQGDTVTVLVSKASRKRWWRNLETPAPVELCLGGRRLDGVAKVVESADPAFREAYESTLDRLPMLTRQFGIDARARGVPLTKRQMAILSEEGRLVQIELAGG